MMEYKKLIEMIEMTAPPELAEDWDNSGIQIYSGREEVSKVIVTLEITDEVIIDALEKHCDMIISHHPLLFGDIRSIRADDPAGARIGTLIFNGISVYSAHTSFDNAKEGNNTYLARKLGLVGIRPPRRGENAYPGVIAEFENELTLRDALDHTRRMLRLGRGAARASGPADLPVKRAAICTGSGFDFIEQAEAEGCDVLITGDVKYHQALSALDRGIAVIDAGHWGTEKIFAENFARQLRDLSCGRVEISETTVNTDPFML